MAKLFRTFALVFAALFALSLMVGCGGGEEEEDSTPLMQRFPAQHQHRVTLHLTGQITVTFDNDPGDVTASAGAVSGSR